MFSREKSNQQSGYLLVLVLVFGGIFFMIAGSFISYTVTQSQVIEQRHQLEVAAEIAEAGLNYYKWFLAHYPNDVTNGTGGPGPFVHVYEDPELGPIGEFSLAIASSSYCGSISSIEVTSTGRTYQAPDLERVVTARYAQPTVAEYAYIINSSVWAGADRTIIGPYHSNQGIRMDGANQSTVTSGQTDWQCTSSFGCNPTVTSGGVFTTTATANPLLFSYPSSPINFTDLSIDLSRILDSAQNNGGIYVPFSGTFGYRVVFNGNGTVTFRRVTDTYNYFGFSSEDGRQQERNIIRNTASYNTYTINPECPIIYVADKIWLEGEVDQKVTIAAAGTDITGSDPDVILEGNITYDDPAEDGLLVIAEDNVLAGVTVPNNMEINGIFIAQNGRFGRNHYVFSDLPNPSGAIDFRPFYARNSLTTNGSVVSNGRVGTQWNSGGSFVSGFQNRVNTYDRNLVSDPPPLVPNTSDVYEFIEWREVN